MADQPERQFDPMQLPPCFQPRVYVCPNPDCLYIGSAAEKVWTGFCWTCCTPITEADVHVFGPESSAPASLQKDGGEGQYCDGCEKERPGAVAVGEEVLCAACILLRVQEHERDQHPIALARTYGDDGHDDGARTSAEAGFASTQPASPSEEGLAEKIAAELERFGSMSTTMQLRECWNRAADVARRFKGER